MTNAMHLVIQSLEIPLHLLPLREPTSKGNVRNGSEQRDAAWDCAAELTAVQAELLQSPHGHEAKVRRKRTEQRIVRQVKYAKADENGQ